MFRFIPLSAQSSISRNWLCLATRSHSCPNSWVACLILLISTFRLVNCNHFFFSPQQNQLTFIPIEIGNLTSLRVLLLSSNLLESLPSSFSNLGNLVHFEAFSNQLKYFSFASAVISSSERSTSLSLLFQTSRTWTSRTTLFPLLQSLTSPD